MSSCAISQEEELHWLALLMLPGLGTVRSLRLLESFGGPQAIFRASASELEGAGLAPALASSIASGCSFDEAVDQQGKLREIGAQVITLHDPLYPRRLRDIFDPPVVLFASGCVELLGSYGIAIVGYAPAHALRNGGVGSD